MDTGVRRAPTTYMTTTHPFLYEPCRCDEDCLPSYQVRQGCGEGSCHSTALYTCVTRYNAVDNMSCNLTMENPTMYASSQRTYCIRRASCVTNKVASEGTWGASE